MKLYNIKHESERVNFKEAMTRGMGTDGGLFFPENLPKMTHLTDLLNQDFVARSTTILKTLLQDELSAEVITHAVKNAFDFPIKVQPIHEKLYVLELFWGPSFAFKDFGARLMANLLRAVAKEPLLIVTATSGDTGAAVAQAFHDIPQVQVAILYPHQRISTLQEKLFCTMGGNIHTYAVKGNFDDCQALVKQCFADQTLNITLNSANSINISRVLAQTLYYFEAIAQLNASEKVIISVPCGNFGNLTAGLLAKVMGLPVHAFVAATNVNDTVPRYLKTHSWDPHPTIVTLTNAMDISKPNNWPRIEEILSTQRWDPQRLLRSIALSDQQTTEAMTELYQMGYIADPHSAIAYRGLKTLINPDETGVFLATAHPAKFKDTVDKVLGIDLPLPPALQQVMDKEILSQIIPNDYDQFKQLLKEVMKIS